MPDDVDDSETPRRHFGDTPLEAGSAVIEGIAAVAIVFILFTVVVQAAIALLARETALSIVGAAARTAAVRPGFSAADLIEDLEAIVPGAGHVDATIGGDDRLAIAWARVEFVPPGPLLGSHEFEVRVEEPRVVAP